jgi:hypothetical protein
MEHIRRFISPPHKAKGDMCITRMSPEKRLEVTPLLQARYLFLVITSKRWSVAANIRFIDTKFLCIFISHYVLHLACLQLGTKRSAYVVLSWTDDESIAINSSVKTFISYLRHQLHLAHDLNLIMFVLAAPALRTGPCAFPNQSSAVH